MLIYVYAIKKEITFHEGENMSCSIVEECVMEAESRMVVRMTETVAGKVGSIEKACEFLEVKKEEYLGAKKCLAELKVELE